MQCVSLSVHTRGMGCIKDLSIANPNGIFECIDTRFYQEKLLVCCSLRYGIYKWRKSNLLMLRVVICCFLIALVMLKAWIRKWRDFRLPMVVLSHSRQM